MRNLIRIHCKRILFRWEAYATAIINLILGILSGTFVPSMITDLIPGFEYFLPGFYLFSLLCMMVSVILMEVSTLNNGVARNQLIAGYTKTQIFVSHFIVDFLYGILQGTILMVWPACAGVAEAYSLPFTISLILVQGIIACVVLTFCLLTEYRTAAIMVCISLVFFMFAGSIVLSKKLDKPQYLYELSREAYETVIPKENLFYIPAPEREVLEQVLRVNPLQPVYEFEMWYIPRNRTYYIKNETRFAYDPLYRMNWQDHEAEYHRHAKRLPILPCYQLGFLLTLCIGGTWVYSKRNLR